MPPLLISAINTITLLPPRPIHTQLDEWMEAHEAAAAAAEAARQQAMGEDGWTVVVRSKVCASADCLCATLLAHSAQQRHHLARKRSTVQHALHALHASVARRGANARVRLMVCRQSVAALPPLRLPLLLQQVRQRQQKHLLDFTASSSETSGAAVRSCVSTLLLQLLPLV